MERNLPLPRLGMHKPCNIFYIEHYPQKKLRLREKDREGSRAADDRSWFQINCYSKHTKTSLLVPSLVLLLYKYMSYAQYGHHIILLAFILTLSPDFRELFSPVLLAKRHYQQLERCISSRFFRFYPSWALLLRPAHTWTKARCSAAMALLKLFSHSLNSMTAIGHDVRCRWADWGPVQLEGWR